MEGTRDGQPKTVCKIRGFTLDHHTSMELNFETMKRLVHQFVETGGQEEVTIIKPKIARLRDATVVTRQEKKTYKVRYFLN